MKQVVGTTRASGRNRAEATAARRTIPSLVAVIQGPGRIMLLDGKPVPAQDLEDGRVYDFYHSPQERRAELRPWVSATKRGR